MTLYAVCSELSNAFLKHQVAMDYYIHYSPLFYAQLSYQGKINFSAILDAAIIACKLLGLSDMYVLIYCLFYTTGVLSDWRR